MIAEYVVTALLSASTPQPGVLAQAQTPLTANAILQPIGSTATPASQRVQVAHDDESPKETISFHR
jgi:hypothetical protein